MAATLQASSLSCLQKAVQSVKSTKAVSTRNASQKFVVSAKLTRTSVQEASVAAVKNIVGEDACRKLTNLSFIALNAYLTMPALAEEEKGKIFDFNLTLPIITVQFLLLAFGLNKLWFEPVGSFMDTRDDEIRKNLLNARDNSDELNKLRAEAEGLLKAARAESAAAIERETKKLTLELEADLATTKKALDSELEAALNALEAEKESVSKILDDQVKALASEIVERVVPVKV